MKLPPNFKPGHRAELGTHLFAAEDIVRFARRYDPQPFHVDAEAASKSVLGGLCASGWHTTAVWMLYQRRHAARMLADWTAGGGPAFEYGPSPGFERLRWIRPVYAGDRVTFFNQTASCRPSATRPGWYVMVGDMEGINQDGNPVLTFTSSVLVRFPA